MFGFNTKVETKRTVSEAVGAFTKEFADIQAEQEAIMQDEQAVIDAATIRAEEAKVEAERAKGCIQKFTDLFGV